MNEVLQAIHYIKGESARRKILQGIVDNELSKEECRQVAKEFLENDLIYKPKVR